MRADHSCHCVRRPEHHPPSRSNRVRRRVRDKPATQHRRSPGSRETGASSGGRNPAEQHPIPIHPLGAPWPPRSIEGKMLIAISESRRLRRNSGRYPVNAGLWRLRTGAPSRDVPEKYGKWNSICRRFRRWSACGVWESVATALAETMAESGHYEIDSTTVRAHASAAGGKGGFINELLAARGAGSPVKFIVSVMPEGDQSPSTSRLAKRQTAKATTR